MHCFIILKINYLTVIRFAIISFVEFAGIEMSNPINVVPMFDASNSFGEAVEFIYPSWRGLIHFYRDSLSRRETISFLLNMESRRFPISTTQFGNFAEHMHQLPYDEPGLNSDSLFT